MDKQIPQSVLKIYQKIKKGGFEAYLVGGCVRGLLTKHRVEDWDFATNATPDEIQKIFPGSFYENQFGTVGVATEKQGTVEITTYRQEGKYVDRRRPETVTWGKTIEEDLARRDFTINAIALQPAGLTHKTPRVIDPFGGQEDLKAGIIRAVGDPHARFQEDALRLLRAVRIATQLKFAIEENLKKIPGRLSSPTII
ncbi:hypothetical protein HYT17_00985 [Candidatus Microgenomates bacterium]|nr:hypothetical protein [Candidatus Microgenomates bacterium]